MNIETLVIFGIVAVAAWLFWWTRDWPVRQPIYDANVRQSPWPDRLMAFIVIGLTVALVIANAARLFIVF